MSAFLDLSWHGEIAAGDALVGLGTLALAWFTWRLARQTKADVETSQHAIEAADMPYVIATPVSTKEQVFMRRSRERGPTLLVKQHLGFVDGDGGPDVEMRLWNVGKGPAIVKHVQLDINDRQVTGHLSTQYPIAPAQVADIRLETLIKSVDDLKIREHPMMMRGRLRIVYAHASGTSYETNSMVHVDGMSLVCDSFERRRL
jgi:hypothetical protein